MSLESYFPGPGLSLAVNTPCAQHFPGTKPDILTPTEICCESTAQLKNIVASLGQPQTHTQATKTHS